MDPKEQIEMLKKKNKDLNSLDARMETKYLLRKQKMQTKLNSTKVFLEQNEKQFLIKPATLGIIDSNLLSFRLKDEVRRNNKY